MTVNRSLKIALVYNIPALSPDDRDYASEAGVWESVAALKSALAAVGHATIEIPAADSLGDIIQRLAQFQPDVVANLCESWRGVSAHEPHFAALFELLGLPYTGSPPECLALVRDKARTKQLLKGAGIATADFLEIPFGQRPPENPLHSWLAEGPVFVKPAQEDASLGISFASVTSDWAALEEQVALTHKKYGAALAERYIDGREFNVGIMELPDVTVLPPAEIEFRISANAKWSILTYDGKWSPNSNDDLATPVRCPANVATDVARRIEQTALAAYRITGCRDYARIDLRMDSSGRVFVLEVNANPDIGPDAGFARMLRARDISYEKFANQLVANAFRRRPARPNAQVSSASNSNQAENRIAASLTAQSEVTIRALISDDIPYLLGFTSACGFFRPDEVTVAAELLNEAMREGPAGHYQVLIAENEWAPVGWSCHGRVPLTDATFDLYWIVVDANCSGQELAES